LTLTSGGAHSGTNLIQLIEEKNRHMNGGSSNHAFYLGRNLVSLLHILPVEKRRQSFIEKEKVERPNEGFLHINPAMIYKNLVGFFVGIHSI
jgi:hypothetical protein